MSWLLTSILITSDPTGGGTLPSGQQATIQGKVTGCSGNHPIVILLIGSDYFATNKPLQHVVLKASSVKGGKVEYALHAKPGTYAISAFEDENSNGQLDMGWFGPSEPAQFFRRFTAWRAPRFGDVSFVARRGVNNADIQLE